MSSLSPWMASNKRCRYLSSSYKQQMVWFGQCISAQWLQHPNEKLTFLCNFDYAQSPVVFLQSHLYWVSVTDNNIHCSLVYHLTFQTEPSPCTRAKRQALVLEQYTVLQATMHSTSIQRQKNGKTKVRTYHIETHLICLGHGRHCSWSEMTLTALPACKNSIEWLITPMHSPSSAGLLLAVAWCELELPVLVSVCSGKAKVSLSNTKTPPEPTFFNPGTVEHEENPYTGWGWSQKTTMVHAIYVLACFMSASMVATLTVTKHWWSAHLSTTPL